MVTSTLLALGVVFGSIASLAAVVSVTWIALSLGHHATGGTGNFTSTPGWNWVIALLSSLGIPFALAAWKYSGDVRRISLTMVWLPLMWNAGGLLLASQLIPDIVGTALRRHSAWVAAGELGHGHAATRVLAALGHHTAEFVDPTPGGTDQRELLGLTGPKLHGQANIDGGIAVPFGEDGNAIFMEVQLVGPAGRLRLPYLFDTGASFTTVSTKTARKLGIDVPDDAPTLKFNTASGPRESKMVYLPSVILGEVEVPGVLVSVCDACVNDRTEGLLGLNVMREFYAQMDYKGGRMTLAARPRDGRPNRAYDVEPVVALQVEGSPEVWLGRVHWIITVHNRGTQPLQDVVPEVRFSDGPTLRGEVIPRIEPGEVGRALVEGRATLEGTENSRGLFTLSIAEAYW